MNDYHLAQPRYRSDIDGLRAIAVLSVVGFHAFPGKILGGFVGVDVFFVISGFLISTIIFCNLENDTFSYTEFYARRIRRIFPALLFVLSASLTFGWHVLLAREYQQLGKHIVAGAGFVSNFALWNESGYFDDAAEAKPLLHLWSLGIEEQFYILWPLLLGLLWKRKFNFFAVTAFIALVSFSVNILSVEINPVAAFYSPLSRFWELMIGGILAYVSLHKPHYLPNKPNWQNWQSLGGLALFGSSVVLSNKYVAFPGWRALLPTIGAFLIISSGPKAWLNRNLLSSRALVWVGLISYPLYLWHWPLLSFAWTVEDGPPSRTIRIGVVILAIILATLTYVAIEKPIRFNVQRRNVSYVLIAAMLILASVGTFTYIDNGMMFRLVNNNPAGFEGDVETDEVVAKCFLVEPEALTFPEICGASEVNSKLPLVLVWGDSFAHSVSLGLADKRNVFGFALALYSAGGCPPLTNFVIEARKGCQNINQFVAGKIKELKPDMVILVADWSLYNGSNTWNLLDYEKLRATLVFLSEQEIKNIVILGHLPTFLIDQPSVGNKKFISEKVDRTFYRFDWNSVRVDEKIRSFAVENKVKFISPIELLCNQSGCLISTSKNSLVPVAWDRVHLTKSGSIYLVDAAIQANELVLPVHRKRDDP